MKFTIESPGMDCSFPFLDTKHFLIKDHSIQTLVYRKPTHTYQYLDWNSNCPISAKISVVHDLNYRAKNVCSTPVIPSKVMDCPHPLLLKNNYPNWIIKKPDKKPPTLILNVETGMEVQKNILISVLYAPGFSEEFQRIFHHTNVQVIFKGTNTLKSILMHSRDRISLHLKPNVVYKMYLSQRKLQLILHWWD